MPFIELTKHFPGRNSKQISYRYKNLMHDGLKLKWNREDDSKLMELVDENGENFESLCSFFPKKTANDLAIRYYKKIKHKKLSCYEEDLLLSRLHKQETLSNDQLDLILKKDPRFISVRLKTLLEEKGLSLPLNFIASEELEKTKQCSEIRLQDQLDDSTKNFKLLNIKNNEINQSKPLSEVVQNANATPKKIQKRHVFMVKRCESTPTMDNNAGNSSPGFIYKRYSEDANFHDAFNMHNSLPLTESSLSNFFDASESGPFYRSSMIIDDDTNMDGLSLRQFLNLNSQAFELEFGQINDSERMLMAYTEKRQSLDQNLAKYNQIIASMEKEILSKAKINRSEAFSKLMKDEELLLSQLNSPRQASIELIGIGSAELLDSIRYEIDIQLKLIQIGKLKLEELRHNIYDN